MSGTASFTVGETTYEAPAGTLVMVPPVEAMSHYATGPATDFA